MTGSVHESVHVKFWIIRKRQSMTKQQHLQEPDGALLLSVDKAIESDGLERPDETTSGLLITTSAEEEVALNPLCTCTVPPTPPRTGPAATRTLPPRELVLPPSDKSTVGTGRADGTVFRIGISCTLCRNAMTTTGRLPSAPSWREGTSSSWS